MTVRWFIREKPAPIGARSPAQVRKNIRCNPAQLTGRAELQYRPQTFCKGSLIVASTESLDLSARCWVLQYHQLTTDASETVGTRRSKRDDDATETLSRASQASQRASIFGIIVRWKRINFRTKYSIAWVRIMAGTQNNSTTSWQGPSSPPRSGRV